MTIRKMAETANATLCPGKILAKALELE
ncbi:hypothetical protein AGR1A_Cc20486 [Agrobacterium fabacearum CFBP 5771]|nr:hypothetical protein AGR1A_Cc20486 [Agrobacterium fabacearum CFBP 5771]